MVKSEKSTKEQQPDTDTQVSYYEGVGKRKESTARVRLYVTQEKLILSGSEYKKGDVTINNKISDNYFLGLVQKKNLLEPFRTTNTLNRFVTSIHVTGGGPSGQMGAIILGISRALEKVDKEKFRPILKKRGFLTRDSRIKQRRKAGFAGKSRARKQSPKR